MGASYQKAAPLRDKDAGARSGSGVHSVHSDELIRTMTFNDFYRSLAANYVDAVTDLIVKYIVSIADNWQFLDDLAGISIQDNQSTRQPARNEKPLASLI
jgi:hypothetical protein